MSAITTHILDTSRGRPAPGVIVVLEMRREDDTWSELARGTTNADGRITDLLPDGAKPKPGVYRLRFGTGNYFTSLGVRGFYPEVHVLVRIEEAGGHYHI